MLTRLGRATRLQEILESDTDNINLEELEHLYESSTDNEEVFKSLIDAVIDKSPDFTNMDMIISGAQIYQMTEREHANIRLFNELTSIYTLPSSGSLIRYQNPQTIGSILRLRSTSSVFSDFNRSHDNRSTILADFDPFYININQGYIPLLTDDLPNETTSLLQDFIPYGLSSSELDTIRNAELKPSPEDTQCSICLSRDYEGCTNMLQLSCSHYFHRECILPWAEVNKKCPVCRCYMALPSNISSNISSNIREVEVESDIDSDINFDSDSD